MYIINYLSGKTFPVLPARFSLTVRSFSFAFGQYTCHRSVQYKRHVVAVHGPCNIVIILFQVGLRSFYVTYGFTVRVLNIVSDPI